MLQSASHVSPPAERQGKPDEERVSAEKDEPVAHESPFSDPGGGLSRCKVFHSLSSMGFCFDNSVSLQRFITSRTNVRRQLRS